MRVGRNISEQLPDCCDVNSVLVRVTHTIFNLHGAAALRLPVGWELAANLRSSPSFRFKWRI